MLYRGRGELTIFRGNWGAKRGTTPLLNLAPGWGLQLAIEFPSDWHEEQCAIIRLTLLWGHIYLYIPWFRRYPDHHQCSGPTYGFNLTPMGDPDGLVLFLYYGNDDGTPAGNRTKLIYGPWAWGTSVRNDIGPWLGEHDYSYTLPSGEVQEAKAKIRVEEREWRRWWIPYKRVQRCVWVEFDREMGPRAGSWKGGTVGCGYELLPGEQPVACLRRMERERKFRA